MTSAITEFAAAKINLSLAVTGRRADGYHLIDSLVTFADVGDRLEALPADDLTLEASGPFAAALGEPADNLAYRAALALRTEAFCGRADAPGARLLLDKRLLVSSGIGGGSADAAAALRALDRLWGLNWGTARLSGIGVAIGADVPMCLESRPLRARGVGERIETLPVFPALDLVLVNPGMAVATAEVFRRLSGRASPALPDPPVFNEPDDAVGYLAKIRNDLEPPAVEVASVIADVLEALRASPGCRLARMSGSGATCFGIYPDAAAARSAARALASQRPEWRIVATATRSARRGRPAGRV